MSLENLYTKYSGVIELTPKDFLLKRKKVINPKFKNKYGLITFYAPWCKHCINMVETFSDLALQFRNEFIIGAVNCENKKNEKLCAIFRIKSYPTIKSVSKKGFLSDYKGHLDKDELIYYICNKIS